METWNYSARILKEGQAIELTKDIEIWTTTGSLFKLKSITKSFKKGTKAIYLDYLGMGGHKIQIGDFIILHIPEYCYEVI